jgi:hypothetical protein
MGILTKAKFWALVIAVLVFAIRYYVPTFPFPDADLGNWISAAIYAFLALFGFVVDQEVTLRRQANQLKMLNAGKKF